MSHKLNALFNVLRLLLILRAYHNIGWELEKFSRHLLDIRLHSCTEHPKCFVIARAFSHLPFLIQNLLLVALFLDLLRNSFEDRLDTLFKVIVYHFVRFV
jgi:hypothetical protein